MKIVNPCGLISTVLQVLLECEIFTQTSSIVDDSSRLLQRVAFASRKSREISKLKTNLSVLLNETAETLHVTFLLSLLIMLVLLPGPDAIEIAPSVALVIESEMNKRFLFVESVFGERIIAIESDGLLQLQ